MNEKEKLQCSPDPCGSCPYRRDTPAGVWAAEEYAKLPAWDDQMAFAGTFLCHSANIGGSSNTVCRGWLEVHERNMSVRLACFRIEWNEKNRRATKVPLYRSGIEAARAGMRGVKRPSRRAVSVMRKLTRARELKAR